MVISVYFNTHSRSHHLHVLPLHAFLWWSTYQRNFGMPLQSTFLGHALWNIMGTSISVDDSVSVWECACTHAACLFVFVSVYLPMCVCVCVCECVCVCVCVCLSDAVWAIGKCRAQACWWTWQLQTLGPARATIHNQGLLSLFPTV